MIPLLFPYHLSVLTRALSTIESKIGEGHTYFNKNALTFSPM